MHRHPPSRTFTLCTATLALLGLASLAPLSCTSTDDDSFDSRWRVDEALPSGVVCTATAALVDPPTGAVYPAGSSPVVAGTAAVGETIPVANIAIAYLMDVSLSTADFGGAACGNPNGDGSSNTTLDCEIAALIALNDDAIMLGTIAEVGVAVFGSSAATGDMDPGGPDALLTEPDADLGPGGSADGALDVSQVLSSANSGVLGEFTGRSVGSGSTSFAAGIEASGTILSASALPERIVVMVSDGLANTGDTVVAAVATLPPDTQVFTFAVGAGSDCDSDPFGRGSLQDVADLTGGTCTEVDDPGDLPEVLPAVLLSNLMALDLTLDGAPIDPIDSVSPVPPQSGPATVTYQHTIVEPGPGIHTVCAEATCIDASGTVDPQECVQFRINTKPDAKCKDVIVPANDECLADASVDDGSCDPDGDEVVCVADPPGPYPLGDTVVTLTCTDAIGDQDSCTGTVTVIDDTPPVVTPNDEENTLWPPNHMYHQIEGSACIDSIHDNCDGDLDPSTAWAVHTATSDEAELAIGSGNFCDDIVLDGGDPTFVEVRSERAGGDDGRVYGIAYEVTDSSGNTVSSTCAVTVRHNPGQPAVDSGCALCVGDDCGACPDVAPTCE